MKTTLIGLILLINTLFVPDLASEYQDPIPKPVEINYLGKLYFISSNNYGCACMMRRSREMDNALEQILKQNENLDKKIEIINIEYIKNRKNADKILDDYELGFPPALILVDTKNKVLFKKKYAIDEKNLKLLTEKIEELMNNNE